MMDDDTARFRRMHLLIEMTEHVITEDSLLTFCEALRLLEAAQTSVVRLFPEHQMEFTSNVRPHLENLIRERFGLPSSRPIN